MRKIRALFLPAVFLAAALAGQPGSHGGNQRTGDRDTLVVSNAERLCEVFSVPRKNIHVVLEPGEYRLSPTAAYDSSCGNCEDPAQIVPITVGLQVSGVNVVLEGPDRGEATVYTNSGYGVYFKDCAGCTIRGLTITGGARDTSQNATDAAIVVKKSRVEIVRNKIVDNIGDAEVLARTIVGIMGICGREESNIHCVDNLIIRNSWDGIALYRDAEALIELNVIDGVDQARGREAGGGRGVGIGVTWNAKATIEKNLVKRYWKGIGIFVDGAAEVRQNIVEQMLTWGVAYWDAGKGKPQAIIEGNVIYDCGACGVSITREAPLGADELSSRLVGNLIVKTAQNPKYDDPEYYCYQCALALHAVPQGFVIGDNLFFQNRRATSDLPDRDVTSDQFVQKKQTYIDNLFTTPFPPWFIKRSDFLKTYGHGAGAGGN